MILENPSSRVVWSSTDGERQPTIDGRDLEVRELLAATGLRHAAGGKPAVPFDEVAIPRVRVPIRQNR